MPSKNNSQFGAPYRASSRFLAWLRGGRPTSRRRAHARQIDYGKLEDRLALTTFVVTTASDNNSGVADGFVSLREAVIAANTNAPFGDAPAGDPNGDMIRFDRSLDNSTLSLTLGQIGVIDDLLIQGGGSNITISGNGNTRLFEITSTERVGFGKLTFENGSAPLGGAMSMIGSGTTLLYQSTFNNNVADGLGGGAVYYANGNMFITESVFESNRATGATGSGGAIYQESGNIYVTDGSIDSNVANQSGGGVSAVGGTFFAVDMDLGSLAAGNVAGPVGSANPGNGGGMHISGTGRVTLQGGDYAGNFAANSGGGMWVGDSANLFVRPGTSVNNNRATGAILGTGGGGIFNDGANVYVNQATVNENTASGAAGSGGGIYSEGGKVVVNLASVDGNAARRTGGGIQVNNAFLQLTNSSVTSNDVGTTFATTVGHGGGIYAAGTSNVVVDDGSVNNNVTTTRGAGIWADTNTLVFLRNSASVSFNVLSDAASVGGGMYTAGYLQSIDAFFQRNIAMTAGGGLHLSGTVNSRIDNTNFFENDGGTRGGGIFNDSSMYITDSPFTGNSVTINGGAYFTSFGATTLADNLTFTNNMPNNTN